MGTITTEYVLTPDGTRIAFDRRGAGAVLVLVDGALSERRSGGMRPLAEHLAGEFTVVTYDRRGRGESTDGTGPVRDYRVQRELDDLARVLEIVGTPVAVHGASTGALLALHAVDAGLPIASVSLFEPPFGACRSLGGGFVEHLTTLLEAGRRTDVVTTFQRAVGIPEQIVATGGGALFAPSAQTIVYDCALSSALGPDVVCGIEVPTLVVESLATSGRVAQWTQAVVEALPRGRHLALPGVWHGIPDADLARALTEFHAPSADQDRGGRVPA